MREGNWGRGHVNADLRRESTTEALSVDPPSDESIFIVLYDSLWLGFSKR
jgi:hypothetical protein